MRHESFTPLAGNQRGFGLVAAMFVMIMLAIFGLLVARYSRIGQIAASEDYLWAQSLYSAETAIRLNILYHDQGGQFGGPFSPPVIQAFTTQVLADTQTDPAEPALIRVRALHSSGVSRTVEAKYLLQ